MRKKLTQREIILALLRSQPSRYFFSYELLKAETPYGWLGSQGDRRARELAEDNLIEVCHDGKYAEYKALPAKEVVIYRAEGREVAKITKY